MLEILAAVTEIVYLIIILLLCDRAGFSLGNGFFIYFGLSAMSTIVLVIKRKRMIEILKEIDEWW